jgi:hypothetical protein
MQNYTKSEGHITANEYNVEKNKALPVTGLGALLGWDVETPTLSD